MVLKGYMRLPDQQRFPKYKRRPEALESRQITDRSLDIIATIDRYRILPSSLLLRLVDGNARITQRHLQALFHKGLVSRFSFPTIGNKEFIYYLENADALRLLVERGVATEDELHWNELRYNRDRPYSAINDPTLAASAQGRLYYIHHEVMISRFHALLELGCKASGGRVELARWEQGSALYNRVEAPKASFYGGLWRMGGGVQQLPHRPDAFFRLRFPANPEGQQYANFYYEADRKTTAESERIIKKLRAHFHYVVIKKHHRAHHNIRRIRAVLVETADSQWANHLRDVARHPVVSGNTPSALFWFTASEFFTEAKEIEEGTRTRHVARALLDPTIVFKRIWASPVDDTLYSLLD